MTHLEFIAKKASAVEEALDRLNNPDDFGCCASEVDVLMSLASKIEALVMLRTHTERG